MGEKKSFRQKLHLSTKDTQSLWYENLKLLTHVVNQSPWSYVTEVTPCLWLNDSNPNKLAHTVPVKGRGVPTVFIPVHRSRAHCKHITLPRCPNAYQITHINHTIWAKSMRAPYFPCFLLISTVPSFSGAHITQSEALTDVAGVAQFRTHRGLLK